VEKREKTIPTPIGSNDEKRRVNWIGAPYGGKERGEGP